MADLDGDGRPDLLSGSYAARVYRWPGVEGGGFGPREDLVVLEKNEVFKDGHVSLHAADWDGDGDTDLLLGSRRGFVHLVENAGTPKAPKFAGSRALAAGEAPLKTPSGDAGPHAADWDGDGDLDLLVGDDAGRVLLFRNAGTAKAPRLEAGTEILPAKGGRSTEVRCRDDETCAIRAKPWVADWDGDGLLDLLVGDFHDHRTPEAMGNEGMHGWVWLYGRKPDAAK